MPDFAALAARLRGCPADCAFWAGDQVEYRSRRDGYPWDPTGMVLGPSNLGRPGPDEDPGERVLREALLATVGAAGRVRVEWYGVPDLFGAEMDLPAAQLRHRGPCPPSFTPGESVILWGAVATGGGLLREGEPVRITGIASSGLITIQAADGRVGETWRSRLRKSI